MVNPNTADPIIRLIQYFDFGTTSFPMDTMLKIQSKSKHGSFK